MRHGNTTQDHMALLKACTKKKDLFKGTRLHKDIIKRGLLEKNPYIACSLISMFVKCGALGKAEAVHAELPIRDTVSWNALIAGYTQQGQRKEALDLFESMKSEGYSPDAVTFTCILKACGKTKNVQMGKQIHEEIINMGLLEKDVVLGGAVVDMYGKCGAPGKAQKAFEELPERNVVSWTSIIDSYSREGLVHQAMECF